MAICLDCKGTGIYQGLITRESCKACNGTGTSITSYIVKRQWCEICDDYTRFHNPDPNDSSNFICARCGESGHQPKDVDHGESCYCPDCDDYRYQRDRNPQIDPSSFKDEDIPF